MIPTRSTRTFTPSRFLLRLVAGAAIGAALWLPARALLPFAPLPVRFALLLLALTWGPGIAFGGWLTTRLDSLQRTIVLLSIGSAAAALTIDILGRWGLSASCPFVAFALGGAGIAAWRRVPDAPRVRRAEVLACVALISVTVALGVVTFRHRLVENANGVAVYGDYDSFDLSFYAAWASEATHTIPPTASYYAGHGLNGAYYPQLALAMVARFADVPILNIYFRYAWPTFLTLGALMVFAFVRSLASTTVALTAAFLVVAGGDFSYLASWWLPHATVDWDYVLWPTNFFSPTMEVLQFNTWAPSLPVFFGALYVIGPSDAGPRVARTVLGAALLAVLFEFKPFAALVLLAALPAAALFSRRDRATRVEFVATCVLGAMGILPFIYEVTKLHEDRRSKFLISFFELPQRMLSKTDLGAPVAALVAKVSPSAVFARPLTLVIATGIFFLVGLGIRWAGIAGVWRAVRSAPEPNGRTWRLLGWTAIAGVSIPFVLVTDPYVDTLQFYQTGLYVLWIFTAVALVRFVRRRGFQGGVIAALVIAASLPSSVHYVLRRWTDQQRAPLATLSRGELAIADYLRYCDPATTVILDDRAEGPSLLTVATARRVTLAWGRRYYAVGSEARLADINAFFSSADDDAAAALDTLRRYHVTHVIVHPLRDHVSAALLAHLLLVVHTTDATLYAVPKPL